MRTISLTKLAEILEGQWNGHAAHVQGVSIDSRQVEVGDLFVAIKGPRFDGHDFIDQAFQQGASAVVVEKPIELDKPVIVVADTLKAFGKLAAFQRSHFQGPVIGITGSCGKTSVKEMTRNILSQKGPVLSNAGNYNNEIGLPITLLKLNDKHEYAVLEMGATKSGDIEYLAQIARPNIGVVTNVAPAHLETMGSLEGIAKTKGEMFMALEQGTAVINADEVYLSLWQQQAQVASRVLTFGHGKAEIQAHDIQLDLTGAYRFTLSTPEGQIHISLNAPGEHQIMNALAASACCLAAGASLEDIQRGLACPLDTMQRLQKLTGHNGCEVWDDSYNAILPAVKSALKVLSSSPKQKIFVFGDMLELGALSEQAHRDIGIEARLLGIDQIYALGPESQATVKAFGEGGHHFEDHQSLINALQQQLSDNHSLLVKGSRGMQMEKVIHAIVDQKEA